MKQRVGLVQDHIDCQLLTKQLKSPKDMQCSFRIPHNFPFKGSIVHMLTCHNTETKIYFQIATTTTKSTAKEQQHLVSQKSDTPKTGLTYKH